MSKIPTNFGLATVEQIVEGYVKCRDKVAQIEAKAKEQKSPFQSWMEQAEQELLRRFTESGIESARTDAGTAYKTTQNSATVQDWDMFYAWATENGYEHMIEHRVSKLAVQDFINDHRDIPPGINWRSEAAINVRRV